MYYPALHGSDLVQLPLNKLLQQFWDLNAMSAEFLSENKRAEPSTKTYFLHRDGLFLRDVDKLQQTAPLSQSRHTSLLRI